MKSGRNHSQEVLSDRRDEWWDNDFLKLMSERFGLDKYQTILDVGCGQGHWGQRLFPYLNDNAQLTGIDFEKEWVLQASRRAGHRFPKQKLQFKYLQGNAENMSFKDGTFDLVTCQTLLMHVAKPKHVLKEMHRVLKVGGRLLLIEPSNLPNQFSTDTVNRLLTAEQMGQLAHLFTACSRGRETLGRGDDSIGDLLPLMLSELPLVNIDTIQNTTTTAIYPPYTSANKDVLKEVLSYRKKNFWLWDKADAFTLFKAGGGKVSEFENLFRLFIYRTELFEKQIANNSYSRAGGSLAYIATGEKGLEIGSPKKTTLT